MRRSVLALCLLAASASAAPRRAKPPHPAAGLPIATITVETHNVFDTSRPPENKLLYRAANRLHIQTREPVIRRELLFEVGDRFDPLLADETARNLRLLSFVRRATVVGTVNKQGTVDVLVSTYDSWTLEVVANYKRAGGRTDIKAGVAEHNILGQGKSGSAVYSRDGGAESKSFGYTDVQFLRYKRLQYSMLANTAPGSQNYSIALVRPFYASTAKRSASATAAYSSSFIGGGVWRRTGEAGVGYGVALATSTERTRRVNVGLSTRRSQSTGSTPDVLQLTSLKVGLEWEELDFLVARRIQNFTRDEDFNLGLAVLPEVSWAPKLRPLHTTHEQIEPGVSLRKGFTWSSQLLLLKAGLRSKYVNGGNGNRVASLDAAHYVRGIKYQTLAFHTALDLGWQLDESNQLSLGEMNGLRGYGLSEFSGDRRFLLNLEDRLYVYDDLFRVLDVGAVAFFDTGYAWPNGTRVNVSDLKSSVGLGLRVAPSRSGSNSPVRIDLAHPLDRRPGRPAWSLSILAGQAF